MDDKELEERLARLRGQPTTRKSDPPITVIINKEACKSEAQKTDELLKKMVAEAALDEIHQRKQLRKQQSTEEEIASRLAKLRGTTSIDVKLPEVERELDSDEEQEILVERLIAECKLPKVPMSSEAKDRISSDDDQEELPWCVLCNEDASIRCYGCENDLYCRKCFKDFHRDPDMRKHKTAAFSKKKKKPGHNYEDDDDID